MLRRLIGEDIELVTGSSPASRPRARRPGQLEQVLMNLAVNARDAMPDGGTPHDRGRRRRARRRAARGRAGVGRAATCGCRCRDTGVGMDAETHVARLRALLHDEGPGKGTGLGLSTVYGIVREGGGGVEVESSPGVGSTFSVLLPATDELATAPEPAPVRTPVDRGHERVLVVEDQDVVRRLTVDVLVDCGYEVLEASDGGEALELCERFAEPIDLLLTDVVMPGMSGVDLAEQVQSGEAWDPGDLHVRLQRRPQPRRARIELPGKAVRHRPAVAVRAAGTW